MTSVLTNYGHLNREVEVTIEHMTIGKRFCAQTTFHETGTQWRTPLISDPTIINDFILATAEYILNNDFNFLDCNGERQWYEHKVDVNAPTLRR